MLRISEIEGQFVGRIVEGLNPTQRARFVFQAPTFTFFALGTTDGRVQLKSDGTR